MQKSIQILLLLLLTQNLQAQLDNEKYHRVKINLEGKKIETLAQIGIETEHGEYRPNHFFTTDLADSELFAVQQAGFETKIEIEDVSKFYAAQLAASQAKGSANCDQIDPFSSIKTPSNYKPGTIGGYFRYQEILNVLDEMRAKFPNLISIKTKLSDTLVTFENRPIYWVRISDNPDSDEPEPEMMYTALHHAREPNSASAMIFYMWYLLENFSQSTEIQYLLKNTELYFVPCMNPDGVLRNEQTDPNGGGLWRKNRRPNGNNSFGVDLNRNYGYGWGNDNIGSSGNPNQATYRGPAPFSEPEIRMLRDFAYLHDFKIMLNAHSFSNLLIYPWSVQDSLAHPGFRVMGKFMVEENRYTDGTDQETVGYSTNGVSDDWFFAENGTFSMTPEVGPVDLGFWPPSDRIEDLNKSELFLNLKAAFCLLKFGFLEDRSPVYFENRNVELPFDLTRLGFSEGWLTASITPVSPNIESFSGQQVFDIQQFETKKGKFDLVLKNTVKAGDAFKIAIHLSNGELTWSDTLTKYFGFKNSTAFANDFSSAAGWQSSNWGVTNEDFISPPTSMTDSPNTDYPENFESRLTSTASLQIPANAVEPKLKFWAKWAIELNYDYAQIFASETQQNWIPLCGKYTQTGEAGQPLGDPVYEGYQNDWVQEEIDLSDFKGKKIFFRLRLVSDNAQEYDGFYMDDFQVEYSTLSGAAEVLPISKFSLSQNVPNPAADGSTTIAWENAAGLSGDAELLIFNQLGALAMRQPLRLEGFSKLKIDTRGLAAGCYFYQIRTAAGVSETLKMVVR